MRTKAINRAASVWWAVDAERQKHGLQCVCPACESLKSIQYTLTFYDADFNKIED